MSQKVIAQIVKEKYSQPSKDFYYVAEWTLLDQAGREFLGSPVRLAEFQQVADVLVWEAGITYEELQKAKIIYEAGRPARIPLSLTDEQIRHMGFRPPESEGSA